MLERELLLTFVATNFMLNISPGPAVLQVVGHSITNGWLPAQASVLGILAGNLVYCSLSALGLGTILLAAPEAISVARYLGIAYLIYLGVRRLFRQRSPEHSPRELKASSVAALFRQSLVLQLANPKSLLFFCSLLPGFIGSTSQVGLRIVILGVLAVALEFPVLFVYSVLGARVSGFLTQSRGNAWLDRASGALMIGAALFVLSVPAAP